MSSFLAAVVQLTSTEDVARNLDRTETLVRSAVARGAALVALPENFAFLSEKEATPPAESFSTPGPILQWAQRLSSDLSIHLLLGSFPERLAEDTRVGNTSALFSPRGELIASYQKIHLFDVTVAEREYRESSRVAPGETPVLAETPLARLGLSICYDLRFPELYRLLVAQGAQVLSIPAAFTLMTGKDHWEPLLRARAIENQCYVIAAAQSGKHGAWRMSYGHSMIIDPWGTVLCRAPDGEDIAIAEINLSRQDKIRAELPALRHRVLPCGTSS
jgi:predicted amidohydrolase